MNSKKLVRIFLMLVFFVMVHTVSVNAATTETVTFDSEYYASTNSDVVAVFGNNAAALESHFLNWGIKEGRQGSIYFDVKDYLAKNEDVAKVFGSYEGAYNHFAQFGLNEGRVASKVFDVNYYLANNSDVAQAFGANKVEVYAHFINFGMAEGRAPSAAFDPKHYLANNGDVAQEFGGYKGAINHYVIWGYKEGRKGGAEDHVYGPETVKEATCTEKGSKVKACKACGCVEVEEVEATGHKMAEGDKGEVVQELTCTQDGIVKFTCENCEEEVTVTTKAEGHDYSIFEKQKTAPTCEAKGADYYTCSKCGETSEIETPALGHNYVKDTSAGAINKEATCSEDGFSSEKCTRCGNVKTTTTPATGKHTYDDTKTVTITKVATCTEPGEVTFTCKDCDKTITEAIAADHVWESTGITVTPNCLEDGKEGFKCARCGATKEETIKATGHNMVESTSSSDGYKAPTCTEAGDKAEKCSACGKVVVSKGAIPATGHTLTKTVKEGNCGEAGKVEYACSACSYKEVKDVAKITHDDCGWTATANTGKYDDGDTWTEEKCNNCDETRKIRVHAATLDVLNRSKCDAEGNVTITEICPNCNEKSTRKEAAKAWDATEGAVNDHTPDEGTITKAPTCNATGVKTYKCKTCGTVLYTETLPKDYTTHILMEDTSASTDATCTTEGTKVYKCNTCNDTITVKTPVNTAVDTTKAHDADENSNHTWVQKEVVKPTCSEKGYTLWECSGCHATIKDTEVAEDLTNGHVWTVGADEITAEGADKGKYVIKIYCDVCKRTHVTDVKSATALTTEDEIKAFVANFDFDTYKTTSDYTNYVASLSE